MDNLKPTLTERRRLTRNNMYKLIYDSPTPVSKQQIATAMEFSLPTVHQNIAELLEAGLIRPGEIQKSTGGRPAVGYTIEEKIRFSVGIAVSATQLRFLLTDIRQNELGFRQMDLSVKDGKDLAEVINRELEAFLEDAGIDKDKILGIGITFPGVIDSVNDTVIFSPTLKMRDLSLKELREAFSYPVFIENDSTSGGSAEWLGLSMNEKDQDFVYLFLENGVGGTVFIDGKPYLGATGRSGEFGHMCIVPGGKLCNCGKRGCLEAYVSAFRYTRDLKISAEDFFRELREGNEEYRKLWEEVLDYLAIGIGNLRMAFDCNVILGGYVSRFMPMYLDELKNRVKERSPFENTADYIKLGKYPNKAGMMGVAWHFVREFIESI